jgi:hypothetical protein
MTHATPQPFRQLVLFSLGFAFLRIPAFDIHPQDAPAEVEEA